MMRARSLTYVWFAWSVIVAGIAYAVPARPLYEPPDVVKAPARTVADLNGSVWQGKYLNANRTFFFEADGTVSYTASLVKGAKGIKNRGFWKLEGDTFTFDHHMGGAKKPLLEFRGVFKDANTIVGEATYPLAKQKAEQTLERKMP